MERSVRQLTQTDKIHHIVNILEARISAVDAKVVGVNPGYSKPSW